MRPRIGELCAGYGGLGMAVQSVLGGEMAWCADNDPGASKILAHHWPDIPNLGDMTTVDWSQVEPVDIITAGWPCQPWSLAGKGKGSNDERAIWPAISEAVGEVRPACVILENVASIVGKGELARVTGDLDALGYVGAWMCLRASDVGATHRRNRCFIVATDPRSEALGLGTGLRTGEPTGLGRRRPDDDRLPLALPSRPTERTNWRQYAEAIQRWEWIVGRHAPAPTEPGRAGNRRLNPRFVEWMQGLPEDHVTDVPGLDRKAQLKALGNGVVPQQAAAAVRHLLSERVAA